MKSLLIDLILTVSVKVAGAPYKKSRRYTMHTRYAYLDKLTNRYIIGAYIKPSYEGHIVIQRDDNNMMVIKPLSILVPVFESTQGVTQ